MIQKNTDRRGGGAMERTGADRRGYLREDFRLFHLRDSEAPQVNYHYHAFD